MPKQDVELLQGTLDVLILKTLSWEPRHGYAVVKWLQEVTGKVLMVEEGSLYPALHRLERRGWNVDDELRHHLELCTEELMAEGLSREAARAEALRRFGDLERVRRECELEAGAQQGSVRRAELWDSLRQDVIRTR
jgi:PadR family transcriptional regulator PadR